MENISDAAVAFWRDLVKIDNETGQWDVSQLVSKMSGNFRRAPRTIANALAVVILASNVGSMLAIGWRDSRTRFTANLRIVMSQPACTRYNRPTTGCNNGLHRVNGVSVSTTLSYVPLPWIR